MEGFELRLVPCHIRGFVDLTFLPAENNTKYSPGFYMVVEPTRLNPDLDELRRSDIMSSYLKETNPNGSTKIQILRIDRIDSPACVIPDVAHNSHHAFLRVRPRSQWSELFQVWLNTEHVIAHEEPDIGA